MTAPPPPAADDQPSRQRDNGSDRSRALLLRGRSESAGPTAPAIELDEKRESLGSDPEVPKGGPPGERSNGSKTSRYPVSEVAIVAWQMAPHRGRPSKLDPVTQRRIVAAVRAGASRRQAADAGGISRATLSRWLSLGLEPGAPERYAEFNRAVRAAQDGAT